MTELSCRFALPARPAQRPWLRPLAAMLLAAALLPAASAREGVDVGPPSMMSKIVPAQQLEQAAAQQYVQLEREAAAQHALAPDGNRQLERLRYISKRIIPHTFEWNPRARDWNWEVNLIGSKQINAFCMPGGKIAFFSGILEKLKLSDDEVAMVMGHEMAHALREHSREQVGKNMATRGVIELGSAIFGLGGGGRLAADLGGQLLSLRFGRDDEREADLVGLELAARAGYDPSAGVTLWKKMAAAGGGGQIEFLSTHPSGPARIRDIQRSLPQVQPLYARAGKPERSFGGALGGVERRTAAPDHVAGRFRETLPVVGIARQVEGLLRRQTRPLPRSHA